ncbi:uncharacterized protein A4U43_C09F14060 [Asparagus officinalis]|uniref:Uncharacterized protein n=1 Tax=Asparagus officinalis TaxID=4686 RepID=A0A5P1E7I9_ASPOF|nr:uncharacterized protein A4U43_C09F14060 [Asparagus officinalis]
MADSAFPPAETELVGPTTLMVGRESSRGDEEERRWSKRTRARTRPVARGRRARMGEEPLDGLARRLVAELAEGLHQ